MLIIVSKDISKKALKKLEKYGTPLLFCTTGITYKSIENHPDIFLTLINSKKIIAAPNTPAQILNILAEKGVEIIIGQKAIGRAYPLTAHYNVVVTEKYIIHKTSLTDESIMLHTQELEKINISQGYTRCNMLALPNNTFITSDKGIFNTLYNRGIEVLYTNPEVIQLKGFKNGFFGGCCGIHNDILFINGPLNMFDNHHNVREFILKSGTKIIELTDSNPEDIGSIFITRACCSDSYTENT